MTQVTKPATTACVCTIQFQLLRRQTDEGTEGRVGWGRAGVAILGRKDTDFRESIVLSSLETQDHPWVQCEGCR